MQSHCLLLLNCAIDICNELADALCMCLCYVAYIVLFDVKLFINMLIG